ncbi:MAG: hypothetical protein D6731_06655 [Planctomycetota bacterium]|nr:MAG: hypothetical protein D6731_06655 [Planctomycetota bacterium]
MLPPPAPRRPPAPRGGRPPRGPERRGRARRSRTLGTRGLDLRGLQGAARHPGGRPGAAPGGGLPASRLGGSGARRSAGLRWRLPPPGSRRGGSGPCRAGAPSAVGPGAGARSPGARRPARRARGGTPGPDPAAAESARPAPPPRRRTAPRLPRAPPPRAQGRGPGAGLPQRRPRSRRGLRRAGESLCALRGTAALEALARTPLPHARSRSPRTHDPPRARRRGAPARPRRPPLPGRRPTPRPRPRRASPLALPRRGRSAPPWGNEPGPRPASRSAASVRPRRVDGLGACLPGGALSVPSRSLTVVATLLLGILGLVFASIYLQNRRAVAERARDRRIADVRSAAASLATRQRKAEGLLEALESSDAVQSLAEPRLDAEARLRAFRGLDALIERLSGDPQVLALSVQRGARRLAGYGAALGAPRGPLGSPPPPRLAERAREESAGRTLFDLNVLPPAGTLGLLAARKAPGGLLLLAAVEVESVLESCSEALADGTWALLDEQGQALYPLGASPPQAPTGPGGHGAAIAGEEVLAAARVGDSPWVLRLRAPVGDRGRVGLPLALSLFAAFLVVVLGLRGVRSEALQRALRESERQERAHRATFDAIGDVLLVLDPDLRIARCNRVAREVYGEDLVGRAYSEAVLPTRTSAPAEALAALREVFSSGQAQRTETRGPSGRVWDVVHYPIFGEDLTVRGVVEFARDVTQTRSLEEQLVQSEKLSTLGEMAAGIAHEINNPIGVVSMYAQLLAEELRADLGADASALEKVAIIEEQANSVGEIVRGLLRFARKSEGTRAPYTLQSAADRALKVVRHQKLLREIDLTLEAPPEPLWVLGDEGQLAQLILNLVVNACHAMDGRGQLRLRLEACGPDAPPPPGRAFGEHNGTPRRARLSVSDTGKGIAPEDLERIFEPFFTTKPAGQGTGLGLSVGFGIIRDHGGCIWVASTPGEGTTFTLDLPVHDLEAEEQAPNE